MHIEVIVQSIYSALRTYVIIPIPEPEVLFLDRVSFGFWGNLLILHALLLCMLAFVNGDGLLKRVVAGTIVFCGLVNAVLHCLV